MIQSICIYCGSADRVHQEYIAAANQLGQALARSNLRLVYGAGKTGLMGAVADGVLAEGGQVTGVVPVHLNFQYPEHRALFISAGEPDKLLAGLRQFRAPANIERWISRDEAS